MRKSSAAEFQPTAAARACLRSSAKSSRRPGPTGALAEVAAGDDGFVVVVGIVWPAGAWPAGVVAFIGGALPRTPLARFQTTSWPAFPVIEIVSASIK